jgi:hydroxymethylpyrimidine pyrophosphatase-like HAD family hydrolase
MAHMGTISDVDGTLVGEEKILTKRAQATVQRLLNAGIGFGATSGVGEQ